MNRSLALVLGLSLGTAHAQLPIDIGINGALSVENCVYGRGQSAITMARNQGLSEIAQFLKGPVIQQLRSSRQTISTTDGGELSDSAAGVLQQQSEYVASGQDIRQLRFETSQPRLMGSETCITVTLVPEPPPTGGGAGSEGESGSVTVVVSGRGEATPEQSARARAELDAQRRAISQVVGVWLTEQSAQSSTMSMDINNESERTEMSDLMTHQLTARSDGYISSWSTLEVTDVGDGIVEVEIEAKVEQNQIVEQSESLLADLGSPRVAIEAPDAVAPYLRDWLNDNGISVDNRSALRLIADADLRESGTSGNNRRLHLEVRVTDSFGNVYGRWGNDPTLIALPNDERILSDLVRVHLATDSQMADFSESLQSAFLDIFRRGGMIRVLRIPTSSVSSSADVRRVLSMTAGISDVGVRQQGEDLVVEMRYPGPTEDLAGALTQQLVHIAQGGAGDVAILDDTNLTFR